MLKFSIHANLNFQRDGLKMFVSVFTRKFIYLSYVYSKKLL